MKVSDAVIIAAIAALPSTIVALKTNRDVDKVADKVEVVHKATNSLTSRLVETTRSDALQEGHADGVKDQKLKESERKK